MTLPALATIADVEATLGRSLTSEQTTFATRLLNMASGLVRGYTRQTFTQVADDVVVLPGNWGNTIELPQRPVTSVKSVVFNGATAPLTSWRLVDSSLFLGTGSFMPDFGTFSWGNGNLWGPAGSTQGMQASGPSWQGPSAQITVTYTHGFSEIPQDLVNEVAGMVALQLNTEAGLGSEQIGGYKAVYNRNSGGGMGLSDDTRMVLNRYRRRASSTSIVVPR
jgi:hypothetical protein